MCFVAKSRSKNWSAYLVSQCWELDSLSKLSRSNKSFSLNWTWKQLVVNSCNDFSHTTVETPAYLELTGGKMQFLARHKVLSVHISAGEGISNSSAVEPSVEIC